MTLEQLIYFSEVFRLKSINAASFNLNISQQSLSTSIRQLEKEFSSTFFIRSHKGVLATPAGERFYSSTQNMLYEYFVLQHDLAATNKPQRCKIGLFCALSSSMASKLFNYLNNLFPDTFFDITFFTYNNFYKQSTVTWPDIIFTSYPRFIQKSNQDVILKSYTLKYLSQTPTHPFLWCNTQSLLSQYNIITPKLLNTNSVISPKYMTNAETLLNYFNSLGINFLEYYFAETKEIFVSLLKTKPYIAMEICLEQKPILHPYLLQEPNLLLKPLSKDFGSNYFVLLYKK